MRLIKNIRNNRAVVFDRGKFDDWCVYVVEQNGAKHAPFDVTYFTDLKEINKKYPDNKVYTDFLKIYHPTDYKINPEVLKMIDDITETYNEEDKTLIEQWFTVIYAGMIAEENKANAILKKRIKHLGVHQTLMQGFEPNISARYSYGKKWRDLDAEMRKHKI